MISVDFENEPIIGKKYRLVNAMDDELEPIVATLIRTEQRLDNYGRMPSTGKDVVFLNHYATFADENGEILERRIVPPLK